MPMIFIPEWSARRRLLQGFDHGLDTSQEGWILFEKMGRRAGTRRIGAALFGLFRSPEDLLQRSRASAVFSSAASVMVSRDSTVS